MKNSEKFTSKASVILAIAMVVVAIFSYKTAQTANQIAQTANQIAQTANQIAQNSYEVSQKSYEIAQKSYEIAQKSYEIAYQSNLPVISAISTLHYDESEGLWTEELTVNNDGFPLSEFRCYVHVFMYMGCGGNETYIPVGGYFSFTGDYTGNSKGLLVSMSEEGNHSAYSSIRSDFRKEASEEGYQVYTWQRIVLELFYEDYTRTSWHRYYNVSSSGSYELSEDSMKDIQDCASANRELMEAEGVSYYITAFNGLNGTELWHWYKEKYLG